MAHTNKQPKSIDELRAMAKEANTINKPWHAPMKGDDQLPYSKTDAEKYQDKLEGTKARSKAKREGRIAYRASKRDEDGNLPSILEEYKDDLADWKDSDTDLGPLSLVTAPVVPGSRRVKRNMKKSLNESLDKDPSMSNILASTATSTLGELLIPEGPLDAVAAAKGLKALPAVAKASAAESKVLQQFARAGVKSPASNQSGMIRVGKKLDDIEAGKGIALSQKMHAKPDHKKFGQHSSFSSMSKSELKDIAKVIELDRRTATASELKYLDELDEKVKTQLADRVFAEKFDLESAKAKGIPREQKGTPSDKREVKSKDKASRYSEDVSDEMEIYEGAETPDELLSMFESIDSDAGQIIAKRGQGSSAKNVFSDPGNIAEVGAMVEPAKAGESLSKILARGAKPGELKLKKGVTPFEVEKWLKKKEPEVVDSIVTEAKAQGRFDPKSTPEGSKARQAAEEAKSPSARTEGKLDGQTNFNHPPKRRGTDEELQLQIDGHRQIIDFEGVPGLVRHKTIKNKDGTEIKRSYLQRTTDQGGKLKNRAASGDDTRGDLSGTPKKKMHLPADEDEFVISKETGDIPSILDQLEDADVKLKTKYDPTTDTVKKKGTRGILDEAAATDEADVRLAELQESSNYDANAGLKNILEGTPVKSDSTQDEIFGLLNASYHKRSKGLAGFLLKATKEGNNRGADWAKEKLVAMQKEFKKMSEVAKSDKMTDEMLEKYTSGGSYDELLENDVKDYVNKNLPIDKGTLKKSDVNALVDLGFPKSVAQKMRVTDDVLKNGEWVPGFGDYELAKQRASTVGPEVIRDFFSKGGTMQALRESPKLKDMDRLFLDGLSGKGSVSAKGAQAEAVASKPNTIVSMSDEAKAQSKPALKLVEGETFSLGEEGLKRLGVSEKQYKQLRRAFSDEEMSTLSRDEVTKFTGLVMDGKGFKAKDLFKAARKEGGEAAASVESKRPPHVTGDIEPGQYHRLVKLGVSEEVAGAISRSRAERAMAAYNHPDGGKKALMKFLVEGRTPSKASESTKFEKYIGTEKDVPLPLGGDPAESIEDLRKTIAEMNAKEAKVEAKKAADAAKRKAAREAKKK